MATKNITLITIASFILITGSLCSLRSLTETQSTPNCSAIGCAACTADGTCALCVDSYNKNGTCISDYKGEDYDKNCKIWNEKGDCAICAEGYTSKLFTSPTRCEKLKIPIPRCLYSFSLEWVHLCMICKDGYPTENLVRCGPS